MEENDSHVCRFFKVFFPDLHSQRLEISPGFRKYAKDLILGAVSLIGPSGNQWEVELAEVGGKLFFQRAWADFARDHELQAGEFLVFEYEGGCRFDVLVLDHSGCEKEYAFLVRPETREKGLGVSRVPVDGLSPMGLVQRCNEVVTKAVGVGESGMKKRGRKPLRDTLNNSEGIKPKGGKRILLSQRRPVQREEVERVEEAMLALETSYPCFKIVMRKSFVYTGYMLNIPHMFARVHLPRDGGRMILLDPQGRSWPITFVCKNGYFFSAGWRKFSIGNHLEELDACAFELIEPTTMRVHIFRVVEELTPMIIKSLKYVDTKEIICEHHDNVLARLLP